MVSRNAAYWKDVDRLHDDTPLETVLRHYGLPEPVGNEEHRMPCVFQESCNESSYGQLAIHVTSKEIFCHSCGVRGNLYTLLHGLETHQPPTGRKLRGDQFKAAYRKLREIVDGNVAASPSPKVDVTPQEKKGMQDVPKRNTPLLSNPKTAPLANLYEELIAEPGEMTPSAAKYFRQRETWLTPEVCRKWGVGYIPKNGRSMFKNWIVYTHRNERGEVISYSGRNAAYDEQYEKWSRTGRQPDKKPIKHKYVKGYGRGLELYGQMASRLDEAPLRESLALRGLGIVEGMNDVIRLDCLNVAAVGLCSNRATEQQIAKIIRFVRQATSGRVWLMPDNDEEGESGAKDLLWHLYEAGLHPTLAWSRQMFSGIFNGKQPENINQQQWQQIDSQIQSVRT